MPENKDTAADERALRKDAHQEQLAEARSERDLAKEQRTATRAAAKTDRELAQASGADPSAYGETVEMGGVEIPVATEEGGRVWNQWEDDVAKDLQEQAARENAEKLGLEPAQSPTGPTGSTGSTGTTGVTGSTAATR